MLILCFFNFQLDKPGHATNFWSYLLITTRTSKEREMDIIYTIYLHVERETYSRKIHISWVAIVVISRIFLNLNTLLGKYKFVFPQKLLYEKYTDQSSNLLETNLTASQTHYCFKSLRPCDIPPKIIRKLSKVRKSRERIIVVHLER